MDHGKNIKQEKQQAANKSKPLLFRVWEKGSASVRLKLALLLGIISFVVYANTLGNGYAYDDANLIKENTIVTKGVSAIPEIFSTPYRHGYVVTPNDTYRPLSLVMFAVEYQVSGGSPAIGHFMNLLVFAGCVVLLFLFIDTLFKRQRTFVAFIASLLFALHPIHTESVANIKSRDELLCFLFSFLALNIFVRYADAGKIKHLLVGLGCFFLSLLSKETSITFLTIIPLVFFFYLNDNKKRSAYITTGVVIMAAVFLTIRASVLNAYNANHSADIAFIDNFLTQAPSLAIRLATAIQILGFYLKLLLIPYPLICDYSYHSISFVGFDNVVVLLSLVSYGLLVFFGISGLIKRQKNPFAFAILFFLITISLFSNIPFLIGTALGERLLFFPSVGFCLIAALLIEKWAGPAMAASAGIWKSPKALVIMIPVGLIYTVVIINRNNEWKDNDTLYKADVEKSPNDSKLCFLTGFEIVKKIKSERPTEPDQIQLLKDATAYLEKATEMYTDYEAAHAELGRAYYIAGSYDLAETEEKKALQLNPQNIDAKVKLAGVYLIKKEYTQSISLYKEALVADPDNLLANFSIAVCYANLQDYGPAIAGLKKAIELNPSFNHYTSFYYLSKIYRTTGKPDSAKMYEDMVRKYTNNSQ